MSFSLKNSSQTTVVIKLYGNSCFLKCLKYISVHNLFLIIVLFKIDSEEEKIPEEKYVDEMAKNLPQGTDKTPEVLDAALSGLSARYLLKIDSYLYCVLFIICTHKKNY